MNMSQAALPARYGHASAADEMHPRFAEYRTYRASMSCLLVDSSDFRDWLHQQEAQAARDASTSHPQYADFLAWMRAEQGGARRCPSPAGNGFPHNFEYWLAGGRW